MRAFSTALIIFSIFVSACDLVTYSPYEADAKYNDLTNNNLQKILVNNQQNFSPYKISAIADSQNFFNELSKITHDINADKDNVFTIVSGDLTEEGLLSEYNYNYDILSSLNKPFITAIGNHDAINNGKLIYKQMYGEYDYSFVFNNVKFIILNSNSNQFPGAPDNIWVEQELSDSFTYQHIILITHDFICGVPPQTDCTLNDIVSNHNVSLVISGHKHERTNYETTLPSGKTIKYHIVGSVGRGHYSTIELDFENITIKDHQL